MTLVIKSHKYNTELSWTGNRDAGAHSGSRRNLLGESLSQEMIDRFSSELNVTAETPPTFLVHSQDDQGVPIENSLLYYDALHRHGVKTSMHIYPIGAMVLRLVLEKAQLKGGHRFHWSG